MIDYMDGYTGIKTLGTAKGWMGTQGLKTWEPPKLLHPGSWRVPAALLWAIDRLGYEYLCKSG
jgi:hypothetical protein